MKEAEWENIDERVTASSVKLQYQRLSSDCRSTRMSKVVGLDSNGLPVLPQRAVETM